METDNGKDTQRHINNAQNPRNLLTMNQDNIHAYDGDIPDNYMINGFWRLTPRDDGTPPATVKYFISPFLDDDKVHRAFIIRIEYPDGVDDVTVKMDKARKTRIGKLVNNFVEGVANGQGYDLDRVPVEDAPEFGDDG